jgi:Fur family transcriptional regulator, ferric uptake regulator
MADAQLAEALRARGLRMTPQRQRVLDSVRTLGHATPEEISASLSDVDVATVYRAVQLLESLGLVAHTHLGHGAPSYRPADDEHIHVVCHDCGRVVDAPAGLAGVLVRRLDAERGFTVDLAHFTVFGRCADCTANGSGGAADDARDGAIHSHSSSAGSHHHEGEPGHGRDRHDRDHPHDHDHPRRHREQTSDSRR